MTTETSTSGERLFKNAKAATSMPFFDGTTLVFCQSAAPVEISIRATGTIFQTMRQNKDLAKRLKKIPRSRKIFYRAWKLQYCSWNDKIVHPIETALPGNMTERSPAFYWEGDRVHLSFISGGPTSAGFYYRLYTCSGPDFDNLSPPQPLDKPPLFFGFVSPRHICWGTRNIAQLTEKESGNTFQLNTSFYRISCVNFLANDPVKLLITGLINNKLDCQTVLYDLASGSVSDVSVGGAVYKSSLYGNHLVFAQKQNEGFENRDLYHGDCTFSPSTIQISKGE